jgi:hypothetical protein
MTFICVDLASGEFSTLPSDRPDARRVRYIARENECHFLPLEPSNIPLHELRDWNTNIALARAAEEAEARRLGAARDAAGRRAAEEAKAKAAAARAVEEAEARRRAEAEAEAEVEAQNNEKQRRLTETKRFRELIAKLSEGEPHEDERETGSKAEPEMPTGHAAGDTGPRGDETQPAKRSRHEGRREAERTKFVYDDLSGAEDEFPPTGHAAGGTRQQGEEARPSKRPKQVESEAVRTTPQNVSMLSEATLADMVKIMKKMGADDDAGAASATSSEAGALSESSAESDAEDMFKVQALPRSVRTSLTPQDEETDRIKDLAARLRDQPLLPCHPDEAEGVRDFDDMQQLDAAVHLPLVHCTFKDCTWTAERGVGDQEHIPERLLLSHFRAKHSEAFIECCGGEGVLRRNEILDYYEEAIKVKARERMLTVSLAQDRRTSRYLSKAYNDDTIHCYICFICAEKHVHVGGFVERGEHCGKASQYKGTIEYHTVGSVMRWIEDFDEKWEENFDFDTWMERYAPAHRETNVREESEHAKPEASVNEKLEHGFVEKSWEWKRDIDCVNYKDEVQTKRALCCPEDVRHSSRCAHELNRTLCRHCSIPLCLECVTHLRRRSKYRIPAALTNDNFQGYAHPFIVLNKVRWIEAVTACPFFTCGSPVRVVVQTTS